MDGEWEVLMRDGERRAAVIVPLHVPMTPEQVLAIAELELPDFNAVVVTYHPGERASLDR